VDREWRPDQGRQRSGSERGAGGGGAGHL